MKNSTIELLKALLPKTPDRLKAEVLNKIQELENLIDVFWSVDDVRGQYTAIKEDGNFPLPELTEADFLKIAETIGRKHDAEVGINWEVINQHIYMYCEDINKLKN